MTCPFQPKIEKEAVEALPVLAYEGRRIVVVDRLELHAEAVADLRTASYVGFDTETKPSFAKGEHNKVALVQLATYDTCYLFRVHKTGLSKELLDLLCDAGVTKVGISLNDDLHMLLQRARFIPHGWVDIQSISPKLGIEDLSLQKIYAIVFGLKISKSQRLTNWEARTLTDKQRMYAAIDAWACMDLYHAMKPFLNQLDHV